MDDYFHLMFLELHNNRAEQITRINAKAFEQTFKALSDITESNHKHFDGSFRQYTDYKQFINIKKIFMSKPENAKYFEDIKSFKFKKFITFTQLANSILHSRDI